MIVMNRHIGAFKKTIRTWLYLLVCATSVGACQGQDAAVKSIPARSGQVVNLTLIAYNYTDNYIDSYQVNGAGGGNVFVSSPTTGGSKSSCCVRWIVGQALPVTVHIRWESSECIYTKRVEGQDFERAKSFYSEKNVELIKPPSSDPKFFETHFYSDGHIEFAITDDYSPPRLKLPRTAHMVRPQQKQWPRCTAAQLRKGDDE